MSEEWLVAPTLGVRDVRAAARFFCEQLGFDNPSFHGPPDETVYAIVHRGTISVHLQIRRREPFPGGRADTDADAYFVVPDVDALRAELVAKGVKLLRDVQDEPYGLRDLTIETPDGHRLGFGTPLP